MELVFLVGVTGSSLLEILVVSCSEGRPSEDSRSAVEGTRDDWADVEPYT